MFKRIIILGSLCLFVVGLAYSPHYIKQSEEISFSEYTHVGDLKEIAVKENQTILINKIKEALEDNEINGYEFDEIIEIKSDILVADIKKTFGLNNEK